MQTTGFSNEMTFIVAEIQRGKSVDGAKIDGICRIREKLFIFVQNEIVMTQIVLNIENTDIIPSLRKVLGQIKGVSIAKTPRKKTAKENEQEILDSIAAGYREVIEAQRTGKQLPRLDDLIKELRAEAAE